MRLIVLLLLLPLAAAQNLEAPDPSFASPALWFHGDGTSETSGWMNTDIEDPDGTDNAWGETEECPSVTLPPVSQPEPKDRTIVVSANGPRERVELDGAIEFRLYVGAGGNGNTVDVSATLDQNGVRIATATERIVTFSPADDAPDGRYRLVTWTVPAQRDHLVADDVLLVTLRMTTDAGNCDPAFFGIGPERGHSHIVLPVPEPVAPEPQTPVFYHDLTGPYVAIDIPYANSTTERHIYNWTNPHPEVNITWAVHGEGVVRVAALLNGTPLPPQAISGNNSLVVEGVQGAWSIQLDVQAFSGRLQLLVRAPQASVPAEDVPEGFAVPKNDPAPGTSQSAPLDFTTDRVDEPKKSGSNTGLLVGVIVAVVLVAAIVVLVVRRG